MRGGLAFMNRAPHLCDPGSQSRLRVTRKLSFSRSQSDSEAAATRCVVLHGETLVFATTAIVATVAEVESASTFRENCLATEVQKVSRERPCYTVQRLLKHVSQRRYTQVSAKRFNV